MKIDINDEHINFILGRPNFWCGPIAEVMRKNGDKISKKAEDEQAAVIALMLNLYSTHGETWRKHFSEWLEQQILEAKQ